MVITPLIRAETWLGAAGWASGSQTCKRHKAGLGAGADEDQDQDQARQGLTGGPDVGKGIAAGGAGKQAEGEQQRERAEARHDDVDVAGAAVVGSRWCAITSAQDDERHELPGEQEGEGVVGEDDKVHGGEEHGVEGQDAAGRLLVRAVADGEQAGAGGAQIGDDEKEGAERVHAEMRADPRQADGQVQGRRGARSVQELHAGNGHRHEADGEADEIDEAAANACRLDGNGEHGGAE